MGFFLPSNHTENAFEGDLNETKYFTLIDDKRNGQQSSIKWYPCFDTYPEHNDTYPQNDTYPKIDIIWLKSLRNYPSEDENSSE